MAAAVVTVVTAGAATAAVAAVAAVAAAEATASASAAAAAAGAAAGRAAGAIWPGRRHDDGFVRWSSPPRGEGSGDMSVIDASLQPSRSGK